MVNSLFMNTSTSAGLSFLQSRYNYVSKTIDNDEELKLYAINFKGLDKAGGYGIQDGFSIFIEKIHGCYFNVMGFPTEKIYNVVIFI